MAIPTFRGLTDDDRFKALDPEQQAAAADRYWDAFAAENPDSGDYAAAQRANAKGYISLNAAARDAAPVERRDLDLQAKDAAFNLRLGEAVSRGEIPREKIAALSAEHVTRTKAERDAATKLRSLNEPEVAKAMQPSFEALGSYAKRGGVFGSPTLEARMSDILPGGEQDAVKTSKEAYTKLRDEVAADFKLSPEELDDVVKHRLDLQEEPVSRDALGTPYVKNEVLAQGADATAAAINNSTLPWSMKQRMVEGLPERLNQWKEAKVNEIVERSPELASFLGLQSPVEDPTNTETKGDLPAGYRYQTADEKFSRLTSALNEGRGSQGASGAVAGLLGSVGMLPTGSEQTPQFLRDSEKITQQINAASADLNTSKTQIFGTDAAAFGQGAYSVSEAIVIGALTGGLGAPIAAERIARLGKWGTALANGFNAAAKVAPGAGFAAAKTGSQTYDQALAAGKTPEEASKLAFTSAAFEFGVTTLFSGIKLGGVEDIGAALANPAAREAFKGGIRQFVGKTALGIAGEELEEIGIAALDAAFVQSKINPEMTVEDLQKTIKDTALVTLAVSGPASALGTLAEFRNKPTYEQSTDELEVRANIALAETALSSEADPVAAGSPAEVAPPALQGGDPAVDGTSSGEPGGSDLPVRDDGTTPAETRQNEGEVVPEPEITPTDESEIESPLAPETLPDTPTEESVQREPEVGETALPDAETKAPAEPATPQSNEGQEEQRQGRQEVLTPEDAVGSADGIPQGPATATLENLDKSTVAEPKTPEKGEKGPTTAADQSAPPIDDASGVNAEPVTETVKSEKPQKPITPPPAPEDSTTGMQNAKVDAARDGKTLGTRHEKTEEIRKELGLPERTEAVPEKVTEWWDAATAERKKDPQAAQKVVNIVANDPKPISAKQELIVLQEVPAQKERVNAARKALETANDENRAEALDNLEAEERQMVTLLDTVEKAGSEWGRAGVARQQELQEDYSLTRMVANKQRAKGEKFTEEDRKEVTRLAKELEASQAKIADLESELATGKTSRAKKTQLKVERDVDKAVKKIETEEKRKALKARLNEKADAAMNRLLGRTNLPLLPSPEMIKDLATVIAGRFGSGIISLQQAADYVVSKLGEKVRSWVPEAYRQAAKEFATTVREVKAARTPAEVLAAITPDALAKRDVYALVKAHIIEGKRGDAVLDAATADLQTIVPGITRDQVATVFTDYGKTIYPSKEEIDVQIRNVRAAEQLALKLKDVLSGKAPLRSGYQRDETNPEIRALQKELNVKMRQAGIKVTSPKQQIKGSLEAAKRRMQNRMEDIRKALADKKPIPNAKTPLEYDQEAKDLRAELDQLEKDYVAAFDKPKLTDKERLAVIEKSLTKRIENEEKMLREGVLSTNRDPKMGPWTPRLAALQQRLDDLQDQRAEARRALQPKTDPRKAAIESLKKQITEYNELLAGRAPKAKGDPKFRPNNEYLALIHQRATLREALTAIKAEQADAGPSKDEKREAATIKRLADAVAKLDREIRAGGLAPGFEAAPGKAKVQTVDSAQVAALKASKKRLEGVLGDLTKMARPPLTPQQVLERKIARIRAASIKRSLNLRDRIRRKDWTPVPKPDPIVSKELEQARLREFQLKRKFNEGLLEDRRANRSLAQKSWDNFYDATAVLGRATVTSIDLGHFGRQLGPMNFARPEIVLRNLKTLFSFTEKQADRVRMKIEGTTPEGKAAFKRAKDAKLGIVDTGDKADLKSVDEVFRSRLAKKIPGVLQSERAYSSNANAVRFDYFNTLAANFEITDAANLKELANHVNNFTGRGSLGKLENSAGLLSFFLFSPKYWLSRLKIIGNAFFLVPAEVASGLRLPDLDAEGFKKLTSIFGPARIRRPEIRKARQAIAKEYARLAVGYFLFFGLAGLAREWWKKDEKDKGPFEIGSDPTSSDFGKLVFQNGTRIDPMAGLSQNMVFLTRMTTGNTSNLKGETTDLDADPQRSRGDVLLRMLRSKLAPLPGSATNLLSKTDMGYKPTRWEKELMSQFLPISSTELYAGFKELGFTGGMAAAISNTFGYGVATYAEKIKDTDAREDLMTSLYQLSGGKWGFPESRYMKTKKTKSFGPKPPRIPKVPTVR